MVKINGFDVHDSLIDAVMYMGALKKASIDDMIAEANEASKGKVHHDKDYGQVMEELFHYACLRMDMGGRDRHIPGLVRQAVGDQAYKRNPLGNEIYNSLMDTDKTHTVASLGYLLEIIGNEFFSKDEQRVMIPVMLFHDAAYQRTKSFKDFTSKKNRSRHMADGAESFKSFATMMNYGRSFFTPDQIELGCAMIAQHDNPGIGLEFNYGGIRKDMLWAQREADRLWMFDRAGFALDLTRRLVEGDPKYDPSGYIGSIVKSHIKEGKNYKIQSRCCIEADVLKGDGYSMEKTLYRTDAGFEIWKRELNERRRDYGIPEKIVK